MVRRRSRLSQAARADRAVPRLRLRLAAGALGLDAVRVADRAGCRSRHHRPVLSGRPALHVQVPLGAAHRRARRAASFACTGPPSRLAGVHANLAGRRHRFARSLRSDTVAAARRLRRAAGGDCVGDARHRHRRVPHRKPGAERTRRRNGRLRRRLPYRHACFRRRGTGAGGLAGSARCCTRRSMDVGLHRGGRLHDARYRGDAAGDRA